jgi:predicted RNA-binding protein YlqC (UPF0109 family)
LHGVLCEVLLKRVCRDHPDEILVEQVAKMNASPAVQRMTLRHDQDEAIGREGKYVKAREVDDVGDDPDVDETLRDKANDVTAWPLFNVNVNTGVVGEDCGKNFGQEFG